MPEQERPQDQLAETGLLRHDHPHLLHRNAQHPPGRAGHRAQVSPLAGEQADLAQELRPAINRDNRLARLTAALDDPRLTGQYHDQVIRHVPFGEQHLSLGHVVLTAVPAQHIKLRHVQDRAAPRLSLLRSSPAAPGRGVRRRSSCVHDRSIAGYRVLVSIRCRIRSEAVRSWRRSAGVSASITRWRTFATWAGALAVRRRSPAGVKIALVNRPSPGSGSRRTSLRSSRRLIRCDSRDSEALVTSASSLIRIVLPGFSDSLARAWYSRKLSPASCCRWHSSAQ